MRIRLGGRRRRLVGSWLGLRLQIRGRRLACCSTVWRLPTGSARRTGTGRTGTDSIGAGRIGALGRNQAWLLVVPDDLPAVVIEARVMMVAQQCGVAHAQRPVETEGDGEVSDLAPAGWDRAVTGDAALVTQDDRATQPRWDATHPAASLQRNSLRAGQ